jgi:DNA repair exonuclease SbcCD ATPase subunit
MKPVSVRFQCFGPYMAEQFIDFALLEKNGLFLICGETGAGKTTILDAMCYALYGESSGGQRGDLEHMRCKLAQKTDETFVEFIFDSLGKRYKFSRSLKYKTKNLHSYQTCYVWKEDAWQVLDTGIKQVAARAERIVGLTSGQFRQVIILPQGKFEEFLVSDSKKKEEILVTLFNVQQWSRICEEISRRVNARGAELSQEKSAITEGLRRYGCETLEALTEKRAALEESLELTRAAAQEAAKALAAAEEAYTAGKLDSELFAQLDRAGLRFQQLKQQEVQMAREREKLALADAADRLRPVYNEYITASNAARRAEGELRKAQLRRTQAAEVLEKAAGDLAAYEAGREKQEKNQKLLLSLEQAREVYASLEALRREAEQARKAWTGAEKILTEKRAVLEKLDRDLAEAFAGQARAKESYDQAQIAYRRSIGGILARTLEEGKACPVCGSTSHPAPAVQAQDHVSEQELDQKNRELTRWGKAVSAAIQARTQGEKARNEAQDRENLEKQKLESAQNKLELALSRRIRGIEDAAALEANLQELQRRIRAYEQQGKKLLDARTGAEGARSAAELAAADCEKQLQAALEMLEQGRKLWEQALGESEFAEEGAFLAAAMEPGQKQKRYQALAAWQGDLKAAQSALEEQKNRLDGKERPDLTRCRELRDRAEAENRGLAQRLILDEKLRKDMTADEKKLTARMEANREALIALEADQVFARRLAGSHGVGLQRYVLGVMMNAITAQANRLLENVYGGRYRLHRTDEASGRTLKGGLELEVSDSHNSERRSVRTLSGGEKFLVALSLAIGLSTVVQAQGEGIRLEAMFIDEGFGSLDRESIQDALEILQSIRHTAGVVGIISHVDALAETIPAQLRITKGKHGSSCRLAGV